MISKRKKTAPTKSQPTKKTETPTEKPKESSMFKVTLQKKAFREADFPHSQAAIIFSIFINNLTGSDVRAFDGVLTFTDPLDNKIFSSNLVISNPIAADATMEWAGQIEYNQFMSSHQKLRNEKLSNLKVNFRPKKILFTEGTTKEFE
ncbi:MAG: hypothetical protein HQK59_12310 [Deltaproteobacteria bacterium]|nr:hypothetical protein [Deltaproteobacteria bacterium]